MVTNLVETLDYVSYNQFWTSTPLGQPQAFFGGVEWGGCIGGIGDGLGYMARINILRAIRPHF